MAFEIIIYNTESYINSLLIRTLEDKYNNAYVRLHTDPLVINPELVNKSIALYDNRDGEMVSKSKQNRNYEWIPLYFLCGKTYLIDADLVTQAIDNSLANSSIRSIHKNKNSKSGRLNLLISLVYPDDRERFISKNLANYITSDSMCIRYDFCWGTLSASETLGIDSGFMTQLLIKANKNLSPDKITEYLNPDSNGFLTPGPTENPDDIYKLGIASCTKLLTKTKEFMNKESSFNTLAVVEGYKTSDILELVPYADHIDIILPQENSCNKHNEERFINTVMKSSSADASINISYMRKEAV